MDRRIWIVPRKKKISDEQFVEAALNSCPEIVNGLPPALIGKISEKQLPIAYEESIVRISPVVNRNPLAEIDDLKAKLTAAGIKI